MWFHLSVKDDVRPVQDTVAWALTTQVTEPGRGSSFLCYATLLFCEGLKPLNEENSGGRLRSIAVTEIVE